MMNDESCRLCSAANIDSCLNIFSGIGIEMNMVGILSEHFRCEISVADPLPNVICTTCWATTKAFHELYETSKETQDKFLDSLVKIEHDPIDVEPLTNNDECNSIVTEIEAVAIDSTKMELNSGDSDDSDNEPLRDYAMYGMEEEHQEFRINVNNEDKDGVGNELTRKAPKRKQWQTKRNNKEYQKLFSENKHLFDMSCDCCSKRFESLEEARKHYPTEHGKPKGYLKCCKLRMFYRCQVMEHITHHLNPDIYKCMQCDMTFACNSYLQKHEKKHQENRMKSFPCEICKKEFTKQYILNKHKKEHKKVDDEMYQKFIADNFDMTCDQCDAKFITFNDAKQHYKECHNEDDGWIKCCGIKLKKAYLIRDHIDAHLNHNSFKCETCGQEYPSLHRLNRHKLYHRDLVFTCDFCSKSFRSKTRITHHLLSNHVDAEPKFECEICRKKFQLSLLKAHMYTHRKKKTSEPCRICNKSFSSNSFLKKHMMTRHTDRKHKRTLLDNELYQQFIADNFDMTCDQCDAKFTAFHDAKRHYKECHNEDNGWIKCCGRKFKNSSLIRDHINTHLNPDFFKHKSEHRSTSRKPEFICDFCDKVLRSKGSVLKHIILNHVNIEPKFECEICLKKCKLKSILKSHMYAAHRQKKANVTCEICGKSFWAKNGLDKHMLTHKDKSERLKARKQCEYCGEWLMTAGGIFQHKQIHTTGVQKCSFPDCGKQLPNRLSLTAHIRQYHRPHKFKCSFPDCGKTFPIGYLQRKHEESHTRHKTYECQWCSRTFAIISSLRYRWAHNESSILISY